MHPYPSIPRQALEKSVQAVFTDRAAARKAADAMLQKGWCEDRIRITDRSDSSVVGCILEREESALWVLALLEKFGGNTNGGEVQSPQVEEQDRAPNLSINAQRAPEPL